MHSITQASAIQLRTYHRLVQTSESHLDDGGTSHNTDSNKVLTSS